VHAFPALVKLDPQCFSKLVVTLQNPEVIIANSSQKVSFLKDGLGFFSFLFFSFLFFSFLFFFLQLSMLLSQMREEFQFNQENSLNAIILVLSTGKSLGNVDSNSYLDTFLREKLALLTEAGWTSSRHVRIDTLTICCTSQKVAAPVTSQEFSQLRLFLCHNMTSSSSDFRQKICFQLEKILKRIREYVFQLAKDKHFLVLFS